MTFAAADPNRVHPSVERRGRDRRARATPMLSRYTFFGGRRRGDRRAEASPSLYVDRYPTGMAVSIVTIALLCALDAVFTLLYKQKGGGEANPLMDVLIDEGGPRHFVVTKCAVTNLGLLVLCLHKNFRYVRSVIATLLVAYTALFGYHIYLAATVS